MRKARAYSHRHGTNHVKKDFMSFNKIFIKEYYCDVCGNTHAKKQVKEYDTSQQGENLYGSKQIVCEKCLLDLFYKNLLNFTRYAVVVAPMYKHNAFICYDFDRLLNKEHDFNIEFINDLKKLIPSIDSKCSCCDAKAQFTYCKPELLYCDPYKWKVNKKAIDDNIYLCNNCIISKIDKDIKEQDIQLETIIPITNGDCLLCSWDI